jgi:hypothetical protein
MPKNIFLGKAKLPTGDIINKLPFEAPWLTPMGMGLIKITDLRERHGVIQAQLADENNVPYENGNTWVALDKFPKEWPQ